MDDALRELERLAAQGDADAIERLERARDRAGLTVTPIVLPQMGESITEATITEWNVGVGDQVRRDQVMAVLETDKICVELPAPDDGVVTAITAAAGSVVTVGAPVAALVASTPSDPGLEATHDALLAAIIAAPDDVAARLTYADFLVETAARGKGVRPWGRETTALRGELIQRHHRSGGEPRLPRVALERVTRTALDLVPFEVRSPRIEGGFLVGVSAPPMWLREHWGRLVECAPITSLEITDLRTAATVFTLPRFEQVRSLTLDIDVRAPALLRELLDAVPASVRELAVRARVAGHTVTEESLREIVGPRLVSARRA